MATTKEQQIQQLQEAVKQLTKMLLQSDYDHENIYRTVLTAIEEPMLMEVLVFTSGNQSQAAELLGLNRATLRNRMKRWMAADLIKAIKAQTALKIDQHLLLLLTDDDEPEPYTDYDIDDFRR